MASEEVFRQTQSDPDDAGVVAELRRLTARVDQLERELATMRGEVSQAPQATAQPIPSSPPPMPGAEPARVEATATMPTLNVALPSVASREAAYREPQASLENRLGAQIFNRIGIVALLCAATLGLKLAIDNHWIGPVGRILIGLVAGAGVILWSERFRQRGFSVFSYSLKAVGTGVLYLSLWAAFQLYDLLPASAALAGMILVTAWNAYMAWVQDAELLAAYALAGGLSTPLLLSTRGNHEIFLFSYLLAIDAATVLLVRLKPWTRLLLAAFPATMLYFIGWYWQYYTEPAFTITTVFITLFFIVFVSVSVKYVEVAGEAHTTLKSKGFGPVIQDILLPLGNAAFVSLALYSVMQDSQRHWFLPWLMLILAAAYLVITRIPQGAVPAAMHLSLAVVFLTIAVPLKASGHWITVAWLVEGVALLWVSLRVAAHAEKEVHTNPSTVLRWLSAGSFVLGLGALLATGYWFGEGTNLPFLNHNFMTALIGVAAFGAAAWLTLGAREADKARRQEHSRFALAAMTAVCAIAVLIALREIVTTFASSQPHPAFTSGDFGMALTGLTILGVVVWVSLRLALADETTLVWAQLSAASVIAINLLAVLAGVREIRALWPVTDAEVELQRSLAVSGFLMLYGAALLAVGFWRRSAFIRWQALVLLVFSIGKTFLYDTRNLSQGYRFVSFLALGALLMAISFAYQKDWLALRADGASAAEANHEAKR